MMLFFRAAAVALLVVGATAIASGRFVGRHGMVSYGIEARVQGTALALTGFLIWWVTVKVIRRDSE
jgi:hypothetical protein